jgi:hypothetical protein
MQVAGIRRLGAQVEMIEVGEPRPLAGDEVLLEVRAAGVANCLPVPASSIIAPGPLARPRPHHAERRRPGTRPDRISQVRK